MRISSTITTPTTWNQTVRRLSPPPPQHTHTLTRKKGRRAAISRRRLLMSSQQERKKWWWEGVWGEEKTQGRGDAAKEEKVERERGESDKQTRDLY